MFHVSFESALLKWQWLRGSKSNGAGSRKLARKRERAKGLPAAGVAFVQFSCAQGCVVRAIAA